MYDVLLVTLLNGCRPSKHASQHSLDHQLSTRCAAMRLQDLLVGRIMVNVQAQLTSVKAEAAKLDSVAVNHGQEKNPIILTVCGPRDAVQDLLVFANELVPQFPQVSLQSCAVCGSCNRRVDYIVLSPQRLKTGNAVVER